MLIKFYGLKWSKVIKLAEANQSFYTFLKSKLTKQFVPINNPKIKFFFVNQSVVTNRNNLKCIFRMNFCKELHAIIPLRLPTFFPICGILYLHFCITRLA